MCLSRRNFLRLSAVGAGGLWLAACAPARQPQQSPSNKITPTPAKTITNSNSDTDSHSHVFQSHLTTRTDSHYLYVESNGMPAHPMMIGIRSWQQQVPLPQAYNGNNAWSIPLNPVLADQPISAKTALYRGAIALAVNGVPIFNALNNRGDDALLAGELDEWGGHAGRADDYHYHIAPLHLQTSVGVGQPIAYALDGFPIYGSTEPDGSVIADLDEFNGHFDKTGDYHYHATSTYPYINGGLRGVVAVRGDQVEPQPHTTPIRPALEPLRGATITNFETVGDTAYALTYQLNNQLYAVNYRLEDDEYIFEFVDAAGQTRTERHAKP